MKHILKVVGSFIFWFLANNTANSQCMSGESMPEYNSIKTYTELTTSTPPYYLFTYRWIAIGGTVLSGQTETSVQVQWNSNAQGKVKKLQYDTYQDTESEYCVMDVIVKNYPASGYDYDNAGNRTKRKTILLNTLKSGSVGGTETHPEEPEVQEQELGELSIKIYPNPTPGQLHVDLSGLDPNFPSSIKVVDISGVIVKSISSLTGSIDIDLSESPSGPYIMIISANNKSTTWRIIKQ
jgi:hypothetical protein